MVWVLPCTDQEFKFAGETGEICFRSLETPWIRKDEGCAQHMVKSLSFDVKTPGLNSGCAAVEPCGSPDTSSVSHQQVHRELGGSWLLGRALTISATAINVDATPGGNQNGSTAIVFSSSDDKKVLRHRILKPLSGLCTAFSLI